MGCFREGSLELKTVDALKKNGFDVYLVQSKGAARDLLLKLIPPGQTVGIAGSLTVREVGVIRELANRGNIVFDQYREGLSVDERFQMRLAQQTCDVFLCSANAVTTGGEIANIDGLGNRVGALAFGPKTIIMVAGKNKIVKNLDEALKRCREVAVKNAVRLQRNTPCVKNGKCIDCSSPYRICNITQIIHRHPAEEGRRWSSYKIIIIEEELGI